MRFRQEGEARDLTGLEDLSGLKESGLKAPSQRFSNLFNAYAKAFNRAYGRTGALFQRPFGRIAVTSDDYFAALVLYIHHNPQRHGLTDDFRTWPFSSYGALVSPKETHLERDQVLAWFDGTDAFVVAHTRPPDEARMQPLIAEDFV